MKNFIHYIMKNVTLAFFILLMANIMPAFGQAEAMNERIITNLEYPSTGGQLIKAVLSMPKGKGPFPIIVTIHGGKGDRSIEYLRTLAVASEVSETVTMLNKESWAVLAISYRDGAIFKEEEEDVVAGIRFAKSLPGIDPARVGLLGGSHGGMLALRASILLGNEICCVGVGSPWMTNPKTVLLSDVTAPPMSLLSPKALEWQIETFRKPLLRTLERMYPSRGAIEVLLTEKSIEENVAKIQVPILFITSLADIQVPHILVKPTIEKLIAIGKNITVYTAKESLHGFYWGRSLDGGAREDAGPKSTVQLFEESNARAEILNFFKRCFTKS